MLKYKLKSLTLCAVSLFLVLLMVGIAGALPFVNPPETNAPKWCTPFPYPRNIDWDFSTNPQGGHSPTGAPGAHYEGWADPVLRVSDFVSFSGNIEWYNTLTGINPTGLIGIDNRTGTETLSGTAIFHIDNTPELWQKNFWTEAEWFEGNGSDLSEYMDVPSGHNVVDSWFSGGTLLSNGFSRENSYYHILPNPEWENFRLEFSAPVGTYVLLDRLHIATECVPEPCTMLLLGSGLLGLAGFSRKKFNKS